MTSNIILYYKKTVLLFSALIFSISLLSQTTIIHQADFETGTDGWTDGGTNASRTPSTAYSGSWCLSVRQNTATSNFISPSFSILPYDKIDFKFFFSSVGYDNDEVFYIEYRDTNTAVWQIIATFKANDISDKNADFQRDGSSNTFYSKTVTIFKTVHTFPTTATAQFRIRSNSNETSEYIYFDKITISGTTYKSITKGPGGITSDLDLWLKADQIDGATIASDGSNLTKWVDNGKGNDAEVVVPGQEPVYRNNSTKNFNFNPVVEFENNNSTSGSDMTYIEMRDELKGTGGFNSNDFFVVLMPDPTITTSMVPLDTFTSTDPTGNTQNEDVTGFGYGNYTARFNNEYLAYCIGTTSGINNGYGRSDLNGTTNYNKISFVNVRHNNTNNEMELYFNANQVGSSTSDSGDFGVVTNGRYWIGRSQYWNGSFDGRIAEIITYSSRKGDVNLTDERNKIQSYLGIKYGITLGSNGTSQDYVDSTGSVIWDQSANSGYNYDIAGIGRDDNSELTQKQSKSVNSELDGTGQIRGLLSVGLTNLYDTNNENISNNATTFNNREFLTWGNNNGDLDIAPNIVNVDMSAGITDLSTPVTFTGMERIWKFTEINGDIPSVKISIPQNAIRNINPPGDYLMFISNTGVFDPTADYKVMTANGANLETDYDFDGTKYVTFGYAPETIVVRSVYFDGVNDYIDMEDALDLNTTEFTVTAWIKRGASSGNTSILSKRDVTYTEGYDFKVTSGGLLELSWKNGTTQTITSDFVIPQNEWHQVAVIFNAGTANLYIDGILDKTVNSLTNPVNTNQSFFIAAAGKTAPTSLFEGNIDEVRVWDVALTVDQLHYIMNQELEKNTTFVNGTVLHKNLTKNEVATLPWSDLAGYYPMSVYTYTNTNDESDNDNQGALRNLDTVDHQTAPLPYKSENNGSWDTAVTWLNNTVQYLPNTTVNGTLVDWNIVETSHDINSTRAVKVLGLKIHSNELSINSDNSLEVTHYLKLDGVIDLDNESQLIQSIDCELDEDSSGYLERDQQGTANSFNYNYWSSSVGPIGVGPGSNNADQTVAGILFDGSAADNGTYPRIINFQPAHTAADSGVSAPINISTYWLNTFNGTSNDYNSWNSIDQTSTIKAGEGYTMKGTSGSIAISTNQNYVFKGKPNNGTITLTIANGDNRLVGNPYPSALDADEFIKDNISTAAGGRNGTTNVFNGAVYFWDHFGKEDSHYLAKYVGGYATYTLMGGAKAYANDARINNNGTIGTKKPKQYIPVNQAFFVNASIDSLSNSVNPSTFGGTITFKNSQRIFITEGSGNSQFMKSPNPAKFISSNKIKKDNRPKIRLLFNSPKGYHRQLLLGADTNASIHFDLGYDGQMVDVGSEDMYWDIDNGKFVVQGIPEFKLDLEIPLGIIIDEEGLIQIEIDELENLENEFGIYIKDNLTGETTNISNQPFEIQLESGEYKDRFSLTFMGQKSLTVADEILNNGILVFMNNSISELQIRNNINAKIESVELFNILGQTLKVWSKNLEDKLISLPINNNSGAYIVYIKTPKGSFSKKIIKI